MYLHTSRQSIVLHAVSDVLSSAFCTRVDSRLFYQVCTRVVLHAVSDVLSILHTTAVRHAVSQVRHVACRVQLGEYKSAGICKVNIS